MVEAASFPEARRPARKLVIFAHGYGSNGEDLIGLARYWAAVLSDAAFVSPNAPERLPSQPGAFQWFGLQNLNPDVLARGVAAAASTLDGFIDAELARHGLAPADCALVGFSQGTMMALHVGLRRAQALAGIVGFSGRLAAPERLAAELRSRPPVLLVHGDRDEVIPVQALFASNVALADAGAPTLWRVSGGTAHGIAEDGLAIGGEFLRDAFAGRYAGWAPPERRA